MKWRGRTVGSLAVMTMAVLVCRAVTVQSVGAAPEVVRVTVRNNDLEAVDGLAAPGSTVELWYRQRNFREGDARNFEWCAWKNGGDPIMLGRATTGADGIWRLDHLGDVASVGLFPGVASGSLCAGGIYTELLPRTCDAPGQCTAWIVPEVHWLNVRRRSTGQGQASGSLTGALRAAIAVADGPNDGPEASSIYDVDEDGIDTTVPGLEPGQRITWRCGSGGTALCPSITVHDASTLVEPDPEFPFLLGTLQGHVSGGSVFAAAAIPRNEDLGFTVNVNVRVKGDLDINLGCERRTFFDFSVP